MMKSRVHASPRFLVLAVGYRDRKPSAALNVEVAVAGRPAASSSGDL